MESLDLSTKILLLIIILHLIAGFAYLIYKLSPREGEELIDSSAEELDDTKSE